MSIKVDKALLNASPQELRSFGLLSAAIVSGLFGLLFPWVFEHSIPVWPWGLSAVLSAWALVHPASLKVVYIPWLHIGAIMGWVNSRILLSIIFYGLITPVGLIVRILGKKLISGIEGDQTSYREIPRPTDNKQMENPY